LPTHSLVTDYGGNGNGVADNCTALATYGSAAPKGSDTLDLLNIGAGTFKFITNATVSGTTTQNFAFDIRNLEIAGAGKLTTILDESSFNSQSIQFGTGYGQFHNGSSFAKIASVSAGASAVTLLTPAEASLFSAGQ
jgi:hypothetical protein